MSLTYHIYLFLWHRSWCPASLRKSLYKRLSTRGPAPDVPFVTDFFGLRYEGNLRNTIDFSIYYYGAFEKPLLFFLRDCLLGLEREDAVFCDIGANIGQHALFMSRYADLVHAFEPYDKVRERLQHQIRLNQLDNLLVHGVGLSATDASLPFFAPTGRNQGIGSFDPDSLSKGNQPVGSLQLVNGDRYFRQQGIDHVDLIKVDVEGFEKQVLLGLSDTLARCRPVLVCEITYGKSLSFGGVPDLLACLPPDYLLFSFGTRKPDGRKARRRGARAKRSGAYRLLPYAGMLTQGQDDIVAVPRELVSRIPQQNP